MPQNMTQRLSLERLLYPYLVETKRIGVMARGLPDGKVASQERVGAHAIR